MEIINNKHIATMRDRIVRNFHPEQIILFGSHARGEAHPHSDVDLLIVISECPDKRKAAIEIRRVLKDMPVPKDIIVSTLEELEGKRDWVGSVLRYVQQEGTKLYEGDPQLTETSREQQLLSPHVIQPSAKIYRKTD